MNKVLQKHKSHYQSLINIQRGNTYDVEKVKAFKMHKKYTNSQGYYQDFYNNHHKHYMYSRNINNTKTQMKDKIKTL